MISALRSDETQSGYDGEVVAQVAVPHDITVGTCKPIVEQNVIDAEPSAESAAPTVPGSEECIGKAIDRKSVV